MAASDIGQLTQEEYDKLSPEEKAQAEDNVREAQQIANTPQPRMPDETEQQQLLQRYQEAQRGGAPLTQEETQKIQTLQQAAQQQQSQYQNQMRQESDNMNKDNLEAIAKKPGFWKAIKQMSTADYLKVGGIGLGAAALSGGGSLLAGAVNAATTMGSYVAAEYLVKRKHKEELTTKDVKTNSYMGATMTPVLYQFFKGLKKIDNPYLTTGVGLGLTVPAFQLVYWPMRHLLNNYTPGKFLKRIFKKDPDKGSLSKEIYDEALKPNFWKAWKDTVKYLGIPIHFVWNYLPLQYQLPATAATRTTWKYVMENTARKNGNEKKEASTYDPQNVMPKYSPN